MQMSRSFEQSGEGAPPHPPQPQPDRPRPEAFPTEIEKKDKTLGGERRGGWSPRGRRSAG